MTKRSLALPAVVSTIIYLWVALVGYLPPVHHSTCRAVLLNNITNNYIEPSPFRLLGYKIFGLGSASRLDEVSIQFKAGTSDDRIAGILCDAHGLAIGRIKSPYGPDMWQVRITNVFGFIALHRAVEQLGHLPDVWTVDYNPVHGGLSG
jgi:hypothetical protein